MQFKTEDSSVLEYFKSVWNMMDIVSLTLTPLLCICSLTPQPMLSLETQAFMGATVSFLLVSKAFDWLRLFDETSFYILLIEATIADIGPFMTLFTVSLFMFAFPLLILN